MKHQLQTIREALEFFECGSYSTSKALTALTALSELERMEAENARLRKALEHIEGVAMADEIRDLPGIVETAQAALFQSTPPRGGRLRKLGIASAVIETIARPVPAQQPQADIIKRQANKIAELTADRDGWIEAHARLHREYHDFRKAAPQQAEAVRWRPDVCPITGKPFFMWIGHPKHGEVPTYGGPYDSYTIPVRHEDGSFCCERYDHDNGWWVADEVHDVGVQIVSDQAYVSDEAPQQAEAVPSDVVRDAARWRTFLATRPANTYAVINQAIDDAATRKGGGV